MQIFAILSFIFLMCATISAQTCPLKCPSCTRCDPKKGTCILPRDFVACTKGTTPGVCFAGVCNTQISLPTNAPAVLGKCQDYRCPQSGVCNLVTKSDGADCTPNGFKTYQSICVSGVCQRVWLGVTDVFPMKNTGCIGKANGVVCDTNDVFTDGETCINGVCKFPDGTFYGYL